MSGASHLHFNVNGVDAVDALLFSVRFYNNPYFNFTPEVCEGGMTDTVQVSTGV